MTEKEAIKHLKLCKSSRLFIPNNDVLDRAIKALEKQIELRENCEGRCIDCKYRGEFHCANDLLIDREV